MAELKKRKLTATPYYTHALEHYVGQYSTEKQALALCMKRDRLPTFWQVHDRWLDRSFARLVPLADPDRIVIGSAEVLGDRYHGPLDRHHRVRILGTYPVTPTIGWGV